MLCKQWEYTAEIRPSGKATANTCHDGVRIANGPKDTGNVSGFPVILDFFVTLYVFPSTSLFHVLEIRNYLFFYSFSPPPRDNYHFSYSPTDITSIPQASTFFSLRLSHSHLKKFRKLFSSSTPAGSLLLLFYLSLLSK